MNIDLISYTPNALELLLFTKGTRLKMTAAGIDAIEAWSDQKKQEELNYMLNTIRSSWEFVDFTFAINGVTRAFTHQLVRHRTGTSFAQQSQRTVDMGGFDYVNTLTDEDHRDIYNDTMREIASGYRELIEMGAKPEDARGVLPTNICTNIIFKANLRTLSHMCGERLCVKAQGEFQDVMMKIRDLVVDVYPWTDKMLRVSCAQTGVCCFPRVDNCIIKDGTFNPDTGYRFDRKVRDISQYSERDELPLTREQIHALWVKLDGKARK